MSPATPFAHSALRLVRQIRGIMARPASAQERLDEFVRVISTHMLADVCSVYLQRSEGRMELCSTEGLALEAVHHTRLEPGEGLVGEVAATARPLSTNDAPGHAAFSFQPETEEEGLISFLGVPILRGGRLLGVLTIQNRTSRSYDAEEVETLQTAAIVLAEVVVEPELAAGREVFDAIALRPTREERLAGCRITDGLVIGSVVKHEPHVPPGLLIADDPAKEEARLDAAIQRLRVSVDRLFEGRASAVGGASRDILEAYQMIAHDHGWLQRLKDATRLGLTAEGAVERVRNEQRARMMSARDPYMRERLHDLEDLANRLLRHLSEDRGQDASIVAECDDMVLFARAIGPAELLEYGPERLCGLVLEEGSPTSHAAIVARAFGIPVVGQIEGVLDQVENGDAVVVDGTLGEVLLRPGLDTLAVYQAQLDQRGERHAAFERIKDLPTVTRDGQPVTLLLNAGLRVDLAQLARTGADGIGLFRTEFQFMIAAKLPRQAEQRALYSSVLDAADGKPVTFRTLDLGGDKILPYLKLDNDENPAMGWRALRLALDRPGLMRYQLRALIAASVGRHLRVMFPLVTTVGEFTQARALLDAELDWATRYGHGVPARVEVGAMIETPAIAFQIDALLREADFVSVGANDLMQFFFAADRSSPRLSNRYDLLSPAGLGFLKTIADACARADAPVSVCGEVAGRPLEAMALMGIGFERLSMPASGIEPVKRMALEVDVAHVRRAMEPMLASSAESLRAPLSDLASNIGAPI